MATAKEPWLCKKDWADGCIRASTGNLVGALIFAGVWNGICAVTCFLFLHNRTGRADEQVFWWFIIPFSITGLGLLWWAGASVLRWRKYGRSVFQMASVPGVIGGQLAGVVRTPVKIEPDGAFCVRLTCTHCTTSRNGDISRNLVWQDEQFISHDLLERDAGHSAVPVLFQIPYECRPTDDGDRFVFPMARDPAGAMAFTLAGAAFSSVPVLMFYWDAGLVVGLFFGIVFTLIGLLCLIFAMDLWFYRSVVDVSHRGLTVTGGLFGHGSPRWIETADVAKIETVSHVQSGKLMYYDLVIVCRDGKRVTAGKRLPGHRLAIFVTRQVERAMGKQENLVGG